MRCIFFCFTEVICVQKLHLFISFLQRKLFVLKVLNRLLLPLAARTGSDILVCVLLREFSPTLKNQSQISSNEGQGDKNSHCVHACTNHKTSKCMDWREVKETTLLPEELLEVMATVGRKSLFFNGIVSTGLPIQLVDPHLYNRVK